MSALNEKNITINLTGDDGPVLGYPNEFKHGIINIITNAKDAFCLKTKKEFDQPEIIHIRLKKDQDNFIIIEVRDNAGGIPSDILDKIFEPYFTTKFQSYGTGIGLYMTKTIIEKNMNGEIFAQNNSEGATFIIKLPLQEKN